jgi:hypothetical protein
MRVSGATSYQILNALRRAGSRKHPLLGKGFRRFKKREDVADLNPCKQRESASKSMIPQQEGGLWSKENKKGRGKLVGSIAGGSSPGDWQAHLPPVKAKPNTRQHQPRQDGR